MFTTDTYNEYVEKIKSYDEEYIFIQNNDEKSNKIILPKWLETLKFGEKFNQPIGVGVLPQSLVTLDLTI